MELRFETGGKLAGPPVRGLLFGGKFKQPLFVVVRRRDQGVGHENLQTENRNPDGGE